VKPPHIGNLAVAVVLAVLSLAVTVPAQVAAPRAVETHSAPRFFKDWRWWIGEGFIVAAVLADAQSSTHAGDVCHACSEGNILLPAHPSHGQTYGVAAGAIAFYTGLHIASHRLMANEPNKWWRFAGYAGIPVEVGTIHGWAADHNRQIVADCRRAALVCK
jgi:hypothetical protein